MEKIAIVTDSNSGITQEKAKKLGIRVLPMPFYIDGELFYEDITLTQEEFYQRLAEDADISTSQPSPAEVIRTMGRGVAGVTTRSSTSLCPAGFPVPARQPWDWPGIMKGRSMWWTTSGSPSPSSSRCGTPSEMRDKGIERGRDRGRAYAGEAGSQYLHHSGYTEIPEEGRKSDTCCRCHRHGPELKAGAHHPGREAGMHLPRCGVSKRPRRPCWTPWRKISRSGLPGRKSTWKAPTPALTKWPRSGSRRSRSGCRDMTL